ncbi:helix-hairpin-helix domain-containing protein [Lutimaribacter marinistellae]|uniref:Helix-hairpin-helix domain-containing protein n=1 Tax=Lutimaribacter marinistellae TaxID=1820329 RepID=A0ABV7TP61_9RHOB
MTPVSKISGVGPALARRLTEAGFDTAEAVAATTPQALSAAQGIGGARAPAIIAAAQQLLNTTTPAPGATKPAPAKRAATRRPTRRATAPKPAPAAKPKPAAAPKPAADQNVTEIIEEKAQKAAEKIDALQAEFSKAKTKVKEKLKKEKKKADKKKDKKSGKKKKDKKKKGKKAKG